MRFSGIRVLFFAALALIAAVSSSPAAAAEKQTLVGVVSDSMCGAQHMESDAAKCTRACAAHGAKYILVVGERLYSLNTTDKGLLDTLSQQAGSKVTVTGTVNGVGVDVTSVAPAK